MKRHLFLVIIDDRYNAARFLLRQQQQANQLLFCKVYISTTRNKFFQCKIKRTPKNQPRLDSLFRFDLPSYVNKSQIHLMKQSILISDMYISPTRMRRCICVEYLEVFLFDSHAVRQELLREQARDVSAQLSVSVQISNLMKDYFQL